MSGQCAAPALCARPGSSARHCSAVRATIRPMRCRDHENTKTRRYTKNRFVQQGVLRASSCLRVFVVLVALLAVCALSAAPRDPFTLDRAGEQWVADTLKKLTLDEKVGQLIVPSFD